MKICHLTTVHLYNDVRIFYKECLTLSKEHDVYLLAPNAPSGKMDGINIQSIDTKNITTRFSRMTKLVDEVFKKALEINADVYHFHDPELIPIGAKLKKYKKKVIYDVHEDVPKQILSKEWLPNSLRTPISKLFEKYERKLSLKFDAIVTASPGLTSKFKQYGCKNVIDLINYPLLSELSFKQIKWDEKENHICYVGGLSKQRGLYEMVNSIEKTKYKLILAGDFIPECEREYVQKLKGWDNVEYKGYVGRDGVIEIYESSKVGLALLHPLQRYKEWLPVKLFEYMASGIPVVVSNFSLWSNFIEKNKCGICVNPLDTEKIITAIEYLINNPQKAKEMGDNGRLSVEKWYNWEVESKKLLELYKSI